MIHALGVGGAETWLMALLRLWSKSTEVQVDFLLTSGIQGQFDHEAERLGARLLYCRFGRTRMFAFTREFRKIMRDGGYDAVHDHQGYIGGWHLLLAIGALPRVRIVHFHNAQYQILNDYGVSLSRRATSWCGKWLVAKLATYIAGTSRQVLTQYGFFDERYSHIPKGALHCGFDTQRFAGDPAAAKSALCQELGWSNDSRILLFVGRIDQSSEFNHPDNAKNAPYVVAIGIALALRDKRVHMILAGQPSPAMEILKMRIAEAELTDRILFLGVRHDIEKLMLSASLLLFPSRGEGLGMVAVEAQAAGLPVLASTAVPNECVVVGGLVRFLDVAPDLGPWLAAIEETLNKERPDSNACNAKLAASTFSIESSAAALERLYRCQKPEPEGVVVDSRQ